MEGGKTVYQKEENNNKNILSEEKKEKVKNNPINGSGSESLLNSLHSDKKEIEHSTKSSIDPLPILEDISMNDSNGNPNQNNNINNNSANSGKQNINNINFPDLIESNLSGIQNISIFGSKNEIKSIVENLKEHNNNIDDSEKKIDNSLDSDISLNNSNENKNEKNNNNYSSINNNSQDKKDKINESNGSEKRKRISHEKKLEIKKKIKEGYIPFFIDIKDYNPFFYYGKPNCQIKIPIEYYFKKNIIPNTRKFSFYYDNKIIDINKTIGELGIGKFGVIKGEIL